MNSHETGSLPVRELPHLAQCQHERLAVTQRCSCPQLRQAEGPGPGWQLPTGEAVLPAGWMTDPLTVGPAYSRLSADEDWMLGCPAVEAACLPRPSQLLPCSLRSPLLYRDASLRALCLGTQSHQLTTLMHLPSSLSNRLKQPT